MRTQISLALLAVLLLTGCTGGQPMAGAAAVAEPGPSGQVQAEAAPEVTPTPTPVPTPTPTPEPTPTPYDYTAPVPESEAVEDEWFADAVFIGDSRTDGLKLYSGIKGVDFLSYKGLSVFELMNEKPMIQTSEGKVSVLQALGQKEYAKVYLSLGLNELGYNHDQGFADTYRSAVDKLKELQPNADIYLQLLIPVSTEKCEQTKQPAYVTNEQIAVYNEIIRAVAAEKEVYLINAGEAMVDETGELPVDASADGIHFYKDGYKVWYEYLKTHTVEKEESAE